MTRDLLHCARHIAATAHIREGVSTFMDGAQNADMHLLHCRLRATCMVHEPIDV